MVETKLKPKISILVITFNHEKFIGEALDGILKQRVEVPIEIIIADDCSTDSTLQIASRYQIANPDIIKILSTEKNLGHTRNYVRAWEMARGDYIAHCDGDDYWTEPYKLARQLDFLERNPSYSSCGHKVWVKTESNGILLGPIPRIEQTIFTTKDMLEGCYPHNSSLLFRNKLFCSFPDFFFLLTGHDWLIAIFNSLKGPIKIFPEIMGVWRMRSDGLWGGRQATFHLEHNISGLKHLKGYLPKKYHRAVAKNLTKQYFLLSNESLKQGDTQKSIECLAQILTLKSFFILSFRKFLSLIMQLKCPKLYSSLRGLRNQTVGEPPLL